MADLHAALESLLPLDYVSVPVDALAPFLRSQFDKAELISNSVPPPPGGDSFGTAAPSHAHPDLAASSKDISVSNARSPDPHAEHIDLQSSWGKPLRVGAKENPLDVKVYKMAAHDRHGAWFARRSVHEGISFSKLQRAMAAEFEASLAVKGGPGAGAIRGIAADTVVERHDLGKTGRVDVLHLSAQFPGPTTPRDFVTLLMTSEDALTGKSAEEGGHIPRHFMIVSRPTTHKDAPEGKNGYIRGSYESVELIREIPLHTKDEGGAQELNPVEWIMVTRSDPGGGIPRFMVERGTPASICADVSKFFDWACARQEGGDPKRDFDATTTTAVDATQTGIAASTDETTVRATQSEGLDKQTAESTTSPPGDGYLHSAQRAFEAGVDTYAPTAVANWFHPAQQGQKDDRVNTESSDTSDSDYESADEIPESRILSQESLPVSTPSDTPSPESTSLGRTHLDKSADKLLRQKEKAAQRLEKKREAEAKRLKNLHEKPEEERAKAQERHEREMKKAEERHGKELDKLEQKRQRELDKARKRRDKQLEKDVLSKVTRERDDFRTRVEMVQRENNLLREQIADVQAENAAFVKRVSRMSDGQATVVAVRQEVEAERKGRSRAGTMKSQRSG